MKLETVWFIGVDEDDLDYFIEIFTPEGTKNPFDFNFVVADIEPGKITPGNSSITELVKTKRIVKLGFNEVPHSVYKGSDGRAYFNLGSCVQLMNPRYADFLASSFEEYRKTGWMITNIGRGYVLLRVQGYDDNGIQKVLDSEV